MFFNATRRLFIWFIALQPQGRECISHYSLIHCFSGWGLVWIAILSQQLEAFPYMCRVIVSSRMPNHAWNGIMPVIRSWQLGNYIELREWWWIRRDINLHFMPGMIQATVVGLVCESEIPILCLYAWFKRLYIVYCWHCSLIGCGGMWATRLTWMLSTCFTCWLFNSMLEVNVPAIYRNLISVYTGCHNFCYGSCAYLCTIEGTRD